jgi:hypothetical protein
MTVDAVAGRAQLSGTAISEGDWITIGRAGSLYLGRLEAAVTRPPAELGSNAGGRSPQSRRSQANGAGLGPPPQDCRKKLHLGGLIWL